MENLYNQLFWEKERSHSRNFIAVSCYSHSILLFVIVVNLSLCLIYKSPLSEVCMHRAGHSTRRVGYHAWFLDSTGGPASITLGYRGGTACGPTWLPHMTGRLTEHKRNCLRIRGADAGVTVPWGNTGRVSGDLLVLMGRGGCFQPPVDRN